MDLFLFFSLLVFSVSLCALDDYKHFVLFFFQIIIFKYIDDKDIFQKVHLIVCLGTTFWFFLKTLKFVEYRTVYHSTCIAFLTKTLLILFLHACFVCFSSTLRCWQRGLYTHYQFQWTLRKE